MEKRLTYRILVKLTTLCIVALTAVSCSVSMYSATGYPSDSMYGVHSKAQIEQEKAQRAAAQQKQQEERMAQWSNILGIADQQSYTTQQEYTQQSEIYNTPYGAKLLALSSGTSTSEYQRPDSYYNYSDTLEELAQYDPALYDATISDSGVVVIEPKYNASIYGVWSDTPYYYNYAWNYGYPSWHYNYVWGYPRYAWNPWSYRYYDPWYDFYPYSYYYSYSYYRPYYRPSHRPSYSYKKPAQKPIVRPTNSSTATRFNSNGSNVGQSTSNKSSSYNRSATNSSRSSSSYSSSSSRSSSSSSTRSSSSSTRSYSTPSRSSGSSGSSGSSSRTNSFGR